MRSFRSLAVPALTAVFAAVNAGAAVAQTSATTSINATADVVGTAPLTASGVNDLNFGTVAAGSSKSPTNLALDAGRFNISGQAGKQVTITFTLPSALTSAASATIPVSFGTTDGLNWTAYPATFVTFNPNAPFFVPIGATGNLVIGISGTVSPATGTITGTYTGTVVMSVTY